jgi:hypothetical protein
MFTWIQRRKFKSLFNLNLTKELNRVSTIAEIHERYTRRGSKFRLKKSLEEGKSKKMTLLQARHQKVPRTRGRPLVLARSFWFKLERI